MLINSIDMYVLGKWEVVQIPAERGVAGETEGTMSCWNVRCHQQTFCHEKKSVHTYIPVWYISNIHKGNIASSKTHGIASDF